MYQQFAAAPTPPPPQVTIAPGNLTESGNLTLYLQIENAVGKTLHSPPVAVAYHPGEALEVTIPASALPEGAYGLRWILSGSLTGSVETAARLADVPILESDRSTRRPLPLTIRLDRDEHLAIARTVSAIADLPTGADLLAGMVRGVEETGKTYRYDPDSIADIDVDRNVLAATPIGRWLRHGSFSTYFGTSSREGADRNYQDINPETVDVPAYPADGTEGLPTHIWVFGDRDPSGNAIAAGTAIGLTVEVNGQVRSQLFSQGKLTVTFLGIVSPDGSLDTSWETAGGEFSFTYGQPLLRLERDLAPGTALWFAVRPQFAGLVEHGARVDVLFGFLQQAGERVPGGSAFYGNAIFNTGGRLKVFPGAALSVIVADGSALIADYQFQRPSTVVYGARPSETDRPLYFDGNGRFHFLPAAAPVPATLAIRARVGTLPGESDRGPWTPFQTLSGEIAVSVSHPARIRADYPDIGGLGDPAVFNPPAVRIYAQRQSDGATRYFQIVRSGDRGATQSFHISDWTAGTAAMPPTAPFGFWLPAAPAIASTGSPGLPADSYRFATTYVYDGNTSSSLVQSGDDIVPILSRTIADLMQLPTAAETEKATLLWSLILS